MPISGQGGCFKLETANREVMDERPVEILEPLGPLVALPATMGHQIVPRAADFELVVAELAIQVAQQRPRSSETE